MCHYFKGGAAGGAGLGLGGAAGLGALGAPPPGMAGMLNPMGVGRPWVPGKKIKLKLY